MADETAAKRGYQGFVIGSAGVWLHQHVRDFKPEPYSGPLTPGVWITVTLTPIKREKSAA